MSGTPPCVERDLHPAAPPRHPMWTGFDHVFDEDLMWEFREQDDDQDPLIFALGAAGGFALGVLLSGRVQPQRRARALGDAMSRGVRNVRDAAARLRPARLRRAPNEHSELTDLEDAVLAAFVGDELLGERGIDIGAISMGIIEISGEVNSEDEAERAVRLARRVAGVTTVVNRLDTSRGARGAAISSSGFDDDVEEDLDDDPTEMGAWQGRRIGMGMRRQGRETDPGRPDDSQHIREDALEAADRDQFAARGYTKYPRNAERPESSRDAQAPDFSEDEMDNQTPDSATPGGAPRPDLNTSARVGEGLQPGTELALEAADVPAKPHGKIKPGKMS